MPGFMGPPGSIQPAAGLSRRSFVLGLAAGGVALSCAPLRGAWASGDPRTLTGSEFDLAIGESPVNFTGRKRLATVINDSLPAPLLRWREGDEVRVRVHNRLRELTSIHWHGIVLPAAMDGTPGLSFPGIAPGESFEYRFRLRQHGTYWYHSHSGLQEQMGLYGPLIVVPRESATSGVERDYAVVLSDWTDEQPLRVLGRLQQQAGYYNRQLRAMGDVLHDARAMTYTCLMNGVTPAGNWTALFRRGERVRLRFINAGAMSHFDVRVPGLPLTVVAADGQDVHPVTVDEFRLGPGETCDVIVRPSAEEPYTIFAQSMDRSGYARGTLAPHPGLSAPVPVPDRRVLISMADKGYGAHEISATSVPTGHEGHAVRHGLPGHDSPGPGLAVLPQGITHVPGEFGPFVDMHAERPVVRLDDPGSGLHVNGRRVLTHADLASIFPDADGREPARTIELHLTGHMHRHAWSYNGAGFPEAPHLHFHYGERLRIVLINDTMMDYPVHLHGMWSDLEDEQGRFKVRKHTFSVQPGHLNSFRVTADAPGRWAFHCHLMLHMGSGMFRVVEVDEESAHG